MELPRENIEFYGDTPEEKKMNEVIYDLSLENDSLCQEITQLTNNWNELEEWLEESKKICKENDNNIGVNFINIVLDKMKEIKEGNNVSSRD